MPHDEPAPICCVHLAPMPCCNKPGVTSCHELEGARAEQDPLPGMRKCCRCRCTMRKGEQRGGDCPKCARCSRCGATDKRVTAEPPICDECWNAQTCARCHPAGVAQAGTACQICGRDGAQGHPRGGRVVGRQRPEQPHQDHHTTIDKPRQLMLGL